METFIEDLDEFFCAQYSDYVRISAIEGYAMPDTLYVASDGNIARRDPECMRLIHQKNRAEILRKLKSSLADTTFTFSFRFPTFRERKKALFQKKETFAAKLPEVFRHCGETAESAGEKLNIEPRFWDKIVKGKLLPEKNTVLALALVCRMQVPDVNELFTACGFFFEKDSVRDIVVQFLLVQKIFNADMRDRCLAEYSIINLPIRREEKNA